MQRQFKERLVVPKIASPGRAGMQLALRDSRQTVNITEAASRALKDLAN